SDEVVAAVKKTAMRYESECPGGHQGRRGCSLRRLLRWCRDERGTSLVEFALVAQLLWLLFFFQAEDGIRVRNVTGVQTCALPISQGEGHGRGRVHGAESLYEQRRPREREGPARTVRRHQDRGAAGALRRHGGRDGGPRRCGPAGPGNPAMDGGAMRAVVAAAVLLSVLPPYRLSAQDSTRIAEAQSVLAPLVETYGGSGAEGPVREAVKRLLPAWARSETDTAGNLWVRVGQGGPVVAFIAHLDEIGFRVSGIRDDGTLELETRGGFFPSLFEAQPALVHTDKGDVAGVFMPRDSGLTRRTPPPLRVDVGATSRASAMARGVSPGATVTMPKQYVRLAGTRATGRSFDDRVGSATQLLALRHLDRAALKHQVIFIWSVREELGLEGAEVAAAS